MAGGSFTATRTRFERNAATDEGGALHVSATGHAVLSNGTLLRGTTAPVGASVRLGASGRLQYELPAPLGRWLLASDGVAELALEHDGGGWTATETRYDSETRAEEVGDTTEIGGAEPFELQLLRDGYTRLQIHYRMATPCFSSFTVSTYAGGGTR